MATKEWAEGVLKKYDSFERYKEWILNNDTHMVLEAVAELGLTDKQAVEWLRKFKGE